MQAKENHMSDYFDMLDELEQRADEAERKLRSCDPKEVDKRLFDFIYAKEKYAAHKKRGQ